MSEPHDFAAAKAELEKTHKKCRELRANKNLSLKEMPNLKKTFTGFDGVERPLKVRYYQIQAALHLFLMKRFVLGDDTGLGKCKPLDSRVLTDRGLLRLGELFPQGVTCTPDTFYPISTPTSVWTGWGWAPVSRFYFNGWKPTVKILTRRGYETSGSLVHPLWVRGGVEELFKKMGELQVGDTVCLSRESGGFPQSEPILPVPTKEGWNPNTVLYSVPEQLSPELASLLAYIVAEGWTNIQNLIYVSQHKGLNPEVHTHIRDLCRDVLGWSGNKDNKDKDELIGTSSVYLRAYLQGLGVGLGVSCTECVPWPIFRATKESVIAFLRAYFDSEGSVCTGSVEVSSASEFLLRDVQLLLLRLGIVSTRSQKKVRGRAHTYWRLALCGEDARKFYEEIGFLTPRKCEALKAFLSKKPNANLDVIPHCKGLVDTLRAEILVRVTRTGSNENRKGTGIRQFGISFEKTLNNIRTQGRNPTYPFLSQLLNICQQVGVESEGTRKLSDILTNRFFYDQIVRIDPGLEEVADIEVNDPQHSFVADGFVNHNTLCSIVALCMLWSKNQEQKVVIFTTKSSVEQWAGEFAKFTKGVRVIICKGTPIQRQAARDFFDRTTGPTVLIYGYRSAVQDFSAIQEWQGLVLIFDEATAFKTPGTQVHQVCQHLGNHAERVWGLTATLIKNHLMEGFGVYSVVMPGVFKTEKNGREVSMSAKQFMMWYAIVRMQPIPRSNRQIPVILGYTKEKIEAFKEVIDPYFLGRPKHEVASELPALVSRVLEVELSPEQEAKYKEALDGLLEVGSGEIKTTDQLTRLIYFQQIVNDLELIGIEAPSPKIDTLLDLLTDGDFAEEKVIVFSKFRKMIDILMQVLKTKKIPAVRITGAENGDQRKAAMDAFQNPDSVVRVCCITAAGSEAINLQAAKALVCYDTPWSAGDFLQCLDSQTEILTQRGFMGIDTILQTDKVAAFDPTTSEITWQPILSQVRRPLVAGEEMYEFCSDHIDFRVTGGHRMLFKRHTCGRDKEGGERVRYWPSFWRFETAVEMANEKSMYQIPVCGVEDAPGVLLTDNELRFIGWFLTDGTLNKKLRYVGVTQANHQPQIKDLRECLSGCGFDWKEYPRDLSKPNGKPQTMFYIPSGTGHGARKRKGWIHLEPYLDKGLAPVLGDIDARQLGVLLEAMHLGNGAKQLHQSWTRRSYHIGTGLKVFADRLQSLCIRRGFRCNQKTRTDPSGREFYTLHIKPSLYRSLNGSPSAHRPKMKLSPIIPNELVWCVENPIGTLVTRRNGKVTIVGNCVGRMVRIGSEHDRCYVIHLVADRKKKSIDQKVMEVLNKKMALVEAVLGKRLKGEGDTVEIAQENEISDLFRSLQDNAREDD